MQDVDMRAFLPPRRRWWRGGGGVVAGRWVMVVLWCGVVTVARSGPHMIRTAAPSCPPVRAVTSTASPPPLRRPSIFLSAVAARGDTEAQDKADHPRAVAARPVQSSPFQSERARRGPGPTSSPISQLSPLRAKPPINRLAGPGHLPVWIIVAKELTAPRPWPTPPNKPLTPPPPPPPPPAVSAPSCFVPGWMQGAGRRAKDRKGTRTALRSVSRDGCTQASHLGA